MRWSGGGWPQLLTAPVSYGCCLTLQIQFGEKGGKQHTSDTTSRWTCKGGVSPPQGPCHTPNTGGHHPSSPARMTSLRSLPPVEFRPPASPVKQPPATPPPRGQRYRTRAAAPPWAGGGPCVPGPSRRCGAGGSGRWHGHRHRHRSAVALSAPPSPAAAGGLAGDDWRCSAAPSGESTMPMARRGPHPPTRGMAQREGEGAQRRAVPPQLCGPEAIPTSRPCHQNTGRGWSWHKGEKGYRRNLPNDQEGDRAAKPQLPTCSLHGGGVGGSYEFR